VSVRILGKGFIICQILGGKMKMTKRVCFSGRTGRTLLSVLLGVMMMASMLVFAVAEDNETWIGDATPDEHEFRIVGMVEKPAYFTLAGLKELAEAEDLVQTRDYFWMNNFPSTDIDTFTGIYFEDLLNKIVTPGEMAQGILVTASDGFNAAFALNDSQGGVSWTAIDGNKMMLAWRGPEGRVERDIIDYDLPRLAVGQRHADDANRAFFISRIVEIRVTAFNDLRGFGWALDAIEWLAEAGVTDGTGGGTFSPNGDLTRAMFVTLLGRALGSTPSEDKTFPDVDYDAWYGPHIGWATEQGYFTGRDDGTFGPTALLTMRQMLIVAERAGLANEDVPETIDQEAVRWATRAEAAVIIYEIAKLAK
jgi:hypothetical protein